MKPNTLISLLALLGATALTQAQTVSMSGAFTGKALLIIDGAPRTVAVGDTVQGVKLVSVNSSNSVVEIKGQRLTLAMGGAQVNLGGAASEGTGSQIVLTAGSGGHFMTAGQINGKSTRFMVDTGASMVSLSQAEAEQLGIDYRHGDRGMASTANGNVPAYRVSLTSVRVGDVTVHNVDALITPVTMPYVLLGNSFLTRFQMQRNNDVLTLTKRF